MIEMIEETFSARVKDRLGAHRGGRVSPKLREPKDRVRYRMDTERAVLGDYLCVSIRRVRFLAVEIAGVPSPTVFRLDTSPVDSESCAIRSLRECSASLPAPSGFPYQKLDWPSVVRLGYLFRTKTWTPEPGFIEIHEHKCER